MSGKCPRALVSENQTLSKINKLLINFPFSDPTTKYVRKSAIITYYCGPRISIVVGQSILYPHNEGMQTSVVHKECVSFTKNVSNCHWLKVLSLLNP